MRSIESTLTLWVSGLLSAGEVVDWANAEIARVDQPTEDLFNLASYGPEKCLKWLEYEFPPRPSTLTYAQQFALRALATSLESRESTFRFADWASRNCFGEDLSDPMVSMGYEMYRTWGYAQVGTCDWRPHTNFLSVLMTKPLAPQATSNAA